VFAQGVRTITTTAWIGHACFRHAMRGCWRRLTTHLWTRARPWRRSLPVDASVPVQDRRWRRRSIPGLTTAVSMWCRRRRHRHARRRRALRLLRLALRRLRLRRRALLPHRRRLRHRRRLHLLRRRRTTRRTGVATRLCLRLPPCPTRGCARATAPPLSPTRRWHNAEPAVTPHPGVRASRGAYLPALAAWIVAARCWRTTSRRWPVRSGIATSWPPGPPARRSKVGILLIRRAATRRVRTSSHLRLVTPGDVGRGAPESYWRLSAADARWRCWALHDRCELSSTSEPSAFDHQLVACVGDDVIVPERLRRAAIGSALWLRQCCERPARHCRPFHLSGYARDSSRQLLCAVRVQPGVRVG
jgi:hypothetical protein